MKPKKLDAAAFLAQLAEIRRAIPGVGDAPPPAKSRRGSGDGRYALKGAGSAEDFEWEAVEEALESLADEIDAVVQQKRAAAMKAAMEVYYAAEELSKDPANAELIPHVERMREAYLKEHGRPIPPKKSGD